MRDASLIRFFRMPARAALLWLLAFVVPLQCSAAVVRLAAGPAHVHVVKAVAKAAPVTLRDFRREIGSAARGDAMPSVLPATLAAVLHGHTHSQRHLHLGASHHGDGGDDSVVASDVALERIDSADDGTAGSGAAFAALLPLLGAVTTWLAPAIGHGMPRSSGWAASSRVAAALERPPRRTQA